MLLLLLLSLLHPIMETLQLLKLASSSQMRSWMVLPILNDCSGVRVSSRTIHHHGCRSLHPSVHGLRWRWAWWTWKELHAWRHGHSWMWWHAWMTKHGRAIRAKLCCHGWRLKAELHALTTAWQITGRVHLDTIHHHRVHAWSSRCI